MTKRKRVYELAKELNTYWASIRLQCNRNGLYDRITHYMNVVDPVIEDLARSWKQAGELPERSKEEDRARADRYREAVVSNILERVDRGCHFNGWGVLSILETAVFVLREEEKITPSGRLGRRIMGDALEGAIKYSDFEKWHDCFECGRNMRPAISRRLVVPFLRYYYEGGEDVGACRDCGGVLVHS